MPPEVAAITEQAGQQQAEQSQQQGGQDQGGEGQQAKPSRPDGLPDSYWNDETGVAFDKLVPELTELQALKAKHDERAALIPEKPEDYLPELPEGFDLPEGMEVKFDPADPVLAEARAWAKEQGLTKDEFKGLIGIEARRQMAEHKQLADAATAERAKLGTKGEERIKGVTDWTTAALGNDLANSLLPMMFTSKQIEAFEKLMGIAKAAGAAPSAGGREANQPTQISDEEYEAMSPTARIERANRIAAEKQRKAS